MRASTIGRGRSVQARGPCLVGVLMAVTLAAACARRAPATTPQAPTPAAAPRQVQVPTPPPQTSPTSIERLRQDVQAATRRPGVQRGAWGIVVHSLDRDERLVEMNPHTLLVPASTAKLVAIASAAEAVGWDYRFETTVRATGPVQDGVLRGDLLVVGTGDPSIGGRGGDDLSTWVEALKAAGVNRIDGRVIGDDDALEEPRPQLAWTWDDLGYTTGALFGALNVLENRFTIGIAPGPVPGAPVVLTVPPHAASRPLVNRAVTGPSGTAALLWPEQRPGEPALTIAGALPIGAPPVSLGVSAGNPTQWFATVLRERLIRSGIAVTGAAVDVDEVTPTPDRAAATALFTHRSRPLSDIAQPLLKESVNLYAEAALRLNVPPGTFPTNDAALEWLHARLLGWGIPAEDQQIIDGSGLSRRDVITPSALVTVLRRMHGPDGSGPFMTGLPVAGVDGSLATRMRGTPAERNVRAKTGTMSNIRSLAGYVTTADGERLAFVVMLNNFEGSGAAATQAVDAIAVRLAGFRRDLGSDRP